MKKIILLFSIFFLTQIQVQAQSNCNNKDFEDSTFTSWSGWTGDNYGLGSTPSYILGAISNGQNASLSDLLARHTLITQNYIDTSCIDPTTQTYDAFMTSLAPGGGAVSVRLGNTTGGLKLDRLTHPYVVTSNNSLFTFQYACVHNDQANHPWEARPFFMVNFLHIPVGNILLGDTIYPGKPNAPYINSPNGRSYRRWSTMSFDLSAYIGQTILLEFLNGDCAYGGHFGYTYLDVSCLGAPTPNVWPGDCDYDLNCNYVDGINLGIAFGSTGPARTNPGNTWAASPSTDWGTNFALGVDYKHSDCDGNGIIDWNDMQVINQNYNSTHPYKPEVNPVNSSQSKSAALPLLQIVPSTTNSGPGNVINFDIMLGTSALPIDDLYAIGFQLNYPEDLIVPGSALGDFSSSWLGIPNQSAISIYKQHTGSGFSDFLISKINQQDTSGFGKIASFQLTTANPASLSALPVTFSGVQLVNKNKVRIPVQTQSCTISVTSSENFTSAGVIDFSFYPNPTHNEINISMNEDKPCVIRIITLTGQVLTTEFINAAQTILSTEELPAGMYLLELSNGINRSIKSLVISRD